MTVIGFIAAVLAGTGGCWIGIRAADRWNETYRRRHGRYPIQDLAARFRRT